MARDGVVVFLWLAGTEMVWKERGGAVLCVFWLMPPALIRL
jgi:hypothetical protein